MNTNSITDFYEAKMIPVPEGRSAVCACFHPAKDALAVGLVWDDSADACGDALEKSEIVVFNASAEILFRKVLKGSDRIRSICYTGSGQIIAAGMEHSVHLITEEQEVWFEESEKDQKNEEGYYPVTLYPGDDENTVRVGLFSRIWNWKTGELKVIGSGAGKETGEDPLSFVSPDSQLKVEKASDTIRLVNNSDGALIRECRISDSEPVCTAFSLDGRRLCVVCEQGLHLLAIQYGQQSEQKKQEKQKSQGFFSRLFGKKN